MAVKTKSPPKGIGNSIFTIFPYKKEGLQWMFDDNSRDIFEESFVSGTDDLLDILCEGAQKCTAIFSDSSFPDHQLVLILKEADENGGDYYCEKLGHDLWLCNATLAYFKTFPKNIYLKIKK